MKVVHGKNPNPQGKGLTPTLAFLVKSGEDMCLPPLEEDSPERVVEEYLSSLLVLSCSFSFRPVPGRDYYLYHHNRRLILSLVAPDEGGTGIYEEYWGVCALQPDLTWTVQYGDEELKSRVVNSSLDKVPDDERLSHLLTGVEEGEVGGYRSHLGYYQRVLHFGLGKSIGLRSRRLLELAAPREVKVQLDSG